MTGTGQYDRWELFDQRPKGFFNPAGDINIFIHKLYDNTKESVLSRQICIGNAKYPKLINVNYLYHRVAWKDRVPTAQKAETEAVAVGTEEPLLEEARHFLKCVEKREVPRTDGWEGLKVLKILAASQESLERNTGAFTPTSPLPAGEREHLDGRGEG